MGVELLDNFNRGLYCEMENGVNGNGNIKTSLKSKILERRKNLGLSSITVDFTPNVSYPMTEDEQDKNSRRKQSNRDSADRCRRKQKTEYVQNEHLLQEVKEEHSQLLRKFSELESVKHNLVNKLKRYLPESKIHTALGRVDYADIIQSKSSDDRGKIGERENSGESNDMMEQINADEVLDEVPDVVNVSDGLLFIDASMLTANPMSYPTNDYPFANCFEDIARPIDDNIEVLEIDDNIEVLEIVTAMPFCDQTVSMVDAGIEVDGPIEQDCVNTPRDLLGENVVNLDRYFYCYNIEHTNSVPVMV